MAEGTQSWLDPLDRIVLKRAAREKATEITLRDGSQFVIEYRTFKDKLDGKPLEKLFIRPKERFKFAPCGWFTIAKL
jgi:hypothetical protein